MTVKGKIIFSPGLFSPFSRVNAKPINAVRFMLEYLRQSSRTQANKVPSDKTLR